MKVDKIRNVAVLGAGMIGSDVSLLCAMSKYPVTMIGRTDKSIERGLARIWKNIKSLVETEVFSQEEADRIVASIQTETDLPKGVHGADIVIEGIIENLQVKQEHFVKLDKHCPPHTLLASGTSGLSPNDIGANIARKDKMLVAHFWNPPYLVPLVELVAHDNISQESLDRVFEFLDCLGKKPILLKKDIAGHIGNRLQHALFREAMYLVEQGVADPEDIDQVIMSSLGPRYSMIGPMEYMDSVGLDLQVLVQSYLFKTLADAKSPQKILLDNYESGDYGLKTGKGFYDWSTRDADEFIARQNTRFIDRLKELKK